MQLQLQNSNNQSRKFLLNIVESIIKYNKSWKNISNNIKIIHKPYSNDKLDSIPDYNNYPDDIRHCIENISKELYYSDLQIRNKNISISIIIDKNNKYSSQYIYNIIRLLYIWLSIAINLHDTDCSQTLHIYLFMTPSIKLMPYNNSVDMARKHINSAFTYSCNKNNNIHVFRKEEWFKVFIHETFHNLGFDFSGIDNGFSDTYASKIFPFDLDFRIYESYCETWATIIHSIFVCCENKNKIDKTEIISDISNIIEKETMFSLFQCNKILHHFGMKYENLYLQDEESRFARIHKYKESTPVISYFFFKTILLYNTNLFVEWCMLHNDSSLLFSNMKEKNKDIYEKIKMYCSLIQSLYKKNDFISSMNFIKKEYLTNITNIRPNDVYYFHTLRMCLHDIT